MCQLPDEDGQSNGNTSSWDPASSSALNSQRPPLPSSSSSQPASGTDADANPKDVAKAEFPWAAGVFDAHCHPTDTMTSIAHLSTMRVAAMVIMATRSQDQHLVADVATSRGVRGPRCLTTAAGEQHSCKAVPSFGWHPWFSHQLYDDSVPEPTYIPPNGRGSEMSLHDPESGIAAAKLAHYQAVLSPPPDDPAVVAALPAPIPISSFIAATRNRLMSFPHALIGEIGLDKAFRLPREWGPLDATDRDESITPGGREGRLLSLHRVHMPHQQVVLRALLQLAAEEGRAVSVHGVQAHGVLYDTLSSCWKGHERHVPSRREKNMVAPGAESDDDEEDSTEEEPNEEYGLLANSRSSSRIQREIRSRKPFPPRICLHSYSGGSELLKQWMHPTVPAKVFVSLSTAVNLSTEAVSAKFADVVRAIPDDRVLVESDLHTAGRDMEAALEDMYRQVCAIKGWELEEGVKRIGNNFTEFIFGGK